jgi:hypothetical protein
MAVASRRNSVALGIMASIGKWLCQFCLTALYEGVHTAVLSHEDELWVSTEAAPGWLAGRGASVLLGIHQAIFDAVAVRDYRIYRGKVTRGTLTGSFLTCR